MKMIVEQTYDYVARMEYHRETNSFEETKYRSLMHERGFQYPYGWIKESGTPPEVHCDCMLMDSHHYNLGDEIEVKIIGMFKRGDGDHKYIVVRVERDCLDYDELSDEEKESLRKLYPCVREGEGWCGRTEAEYCYEHCARAL